MNAQERFDTLPGHYVHMTVEAIVTNWLVGQWAVVNHPETVLNLSAGFRIEKVKIEPAHTEEQHEKYPFGRIYVRGDQTCWFSPELYKVNICSF